MKNKVKQLLLCFFISVPCSGFGQSIMEGNLIGLKVSTMGLSLEAARAIGQNFNVRIGGAYFPISVGFDGDDFEFEGDLTLLSGILLGDWFPFKGAFRLTGGSYLNFTSSSIKLTPLKTQTIGGIQYTVSDMGTVSGDLNVNLFSPYLGLGFGNAGTGRGLAFLLDVGVIYHGKPKIDLNSGSILKPTTDQSDQLEKNVEWAQWFPILSFGVAYRL